MMEPDLFKAILALDSYNRGYDEGINLPDTLGRIGNAEILRDSLQRLGAASADSGFYASSYDWTHEGITETVISYRGTDRPNPLAAANDFWSGWTIGAGFNTASQAQLAIQFYKAVAGVASLTLR